MIQLLRHHEIDPLRWEACLQKAHEPLVYVHAWYLETVCAGNWEALVEKQDEEYVSVFPLPVRTLLGQKKVYQPLFAQQLGLVVTPASQHRTVEEYLALLPPLFSQVQYQLPWPNFVPAALPQSWQGRLRPNYELPLFSTYAALRQQYSTNLRRNLQKAQKAQLVIEPAASISALLALFRQTKGLELPDLKPRHYAILEKLYRRAKEEKVGEIWEVRVQQEVVAAAFVLRTAHRVTFLFGASSALGRQVGAMAFLLDSLVQQEAMTGKTFDFEGSEVSGVAKFYAGFGALPVSYVSLGVKSKPSALQWIPNVFISLAKRLR
ncbi:GNAT family N-acetyltransferase [Rufibacter immobilis]|uniref:GNAT family N-acetyltransferase n=1 Tax=Rufibacter immobilis TaxID=1348778 RepID=A0A3M9N4D7_9BACT|nr:GNAT family N-acetyltransferase [Rufibacter immobilis]RNI32650.1 GNAT family N-acetyltransferase [Rufibacter immobilis]